MALSAQVMSSTRSNRLSQPPVSVLAESTFLVFGLTMTDRDRPTFDEVFAWLQTAGPATLVSSRGTKYRVAAQVSSGTKLIVARPRSGQVHILWGAIIRSRGWRRVASR